MKLWFLTLLALIVPTLTLATSNEQSKDVFARQHNNHDVDDWYEQVEQWVRSAMRQWGRLGRGGGGRPAAPSVGPVRTFTEADTVTATTTICQRWYNCYQSVYTTTVNPRTFTETVIAYTTTAPCQNGGGNCVVITPSQSIEPATGTQLSTVYQTTTSKSCFWGYCGSPVTVTYTTTITVTVTYTATLTASLTPITSPVAVSATLSPSQGATLTNDDSSVTMGTTTSTGATVGAALTGDDSSMTTGSAGTSMSVVTSADSATATISDSSESLSSFTSSASAVLTSLSASNSDVLNSLSSSQASLLSSLQSTGSPSDISSISSVLASSASSVVSSLSSVNSAVTSSLSSQQSSLLGILDPNQPATDPDMSSSQASAVLSSLPPGVVPSTTPINSALTKPSSGLTLTVSVGKSTLVVAPSTVLSTTVRAATTSTSRASSASSATTLRTSTTIRSSTTTTTTAVQATQTINVTGLTYQNAMLTAHNVHRANHSLSALLWDANLASIAGQIASNCVYAHNVTAGGGGYGQNIGAGAIGNAAAGLITNLMYNGEINYYPLPYGNDNPDLSNFHAWGHYSQIVWTSTTSVGCVTQYCPQGLANTGAGVAPYFTVCNYGPPGNYVGEFSQVAAPKGGATFVVVGS